MSCQSLSSRSSGFSSPLLHVLNLAEIQSMHAVVLLLNREDFLGAILPDHVMIVHRLYIVCLGITNGEDESVGLFSV